MKKHYELKHPGKDVKYKTILSGGQRSLLAMYPGRAVSVCKPKQSDKDDDTPKDGNDNYDETFKDVNHSDDDDSDIASPIRKRFCSGQLKGAAVGGDRASSSAEPSTEMEMVRIEEKKDAREVVEDMKDVVENMKNVKDSFLDLLSKFGDMFTGNNLSTGKEREVETDIEVTDQIVASQSLLACKDMQQLCEQLEARGFDFDVEDGVVACILCNQTRSAGAVRLRDSKVGVFGFDMGAYQAAIDLQPHKQPRIFVNLKHGIIKHETESQIHKSLVEKSALEKREERSRMSRNEKIGINLFRIRYNGIMHGASYLNFEEDVLTANLNGTDTGDINNGREFARELSKNIVEVMKEKLSENISKPLEATGKRRPLGLVADKITPNKRTGHITALILPVPENPLSQPFLNPIMLELPPVVDHTADGLSDQLLDLMRGAGVVDSQLEGVGVDGQYIKLGAIKKLICKLSVDQMCEEKLLKWIFEMWEPAHNLNKADEEIRKLQIFDWLVNFTTDVGEVTRVLGIGKGLEQSRQAATELDQQLYKLQAYSVTRFASHVEKTYINTYRSFEIIVRTLQVRAESSDKKVSEVAKTLLSKLLSTKFVGTLLGCIDIYRVIATGSCDLQRVEQFPWEVVGVLNDLIEKLKGMSETLRILPTDTNSNMTVVNMDEEEGSEDDTITVDKHEWPMLSKHLEELKSGKFKNLAIGAGPGRRAGRIRDYMGHENDLLTVQNRLSALCKYESEHIARRTVDNEDHKFPSIIASMEGCLDIQRMVKASSEDEFELEMYGIDCLENVLSQASYSPADSKQIKSEYLLLKERIFDLLYNEESCNRHILQQYEPFIFKTHVCSSVCCPVSQKKCTSYGEILQPRIIITMKILHLFLKFPELHAGLGAVLHLFLRCSAKTHAEGVAESMGNYVDFYSDKKRGLDITAVGDEAFIHWNGPPVHLAASLGQAALDKKFGGRSRWRFITKKGKVESVVVSRLKKVQSRVPFF